MVSRKVSASPWSWARTVAGTTLAAAFWMNGGGVADVGAGLEVEGDRDGGELVDVVDGLDAEGLAPGGDGLEGYELRRRRRSGRRGG